MHTKQTHKLTHILNKHIFQKERRLSLLPTWHDRYPRDKGKVKKRQGQTACLQTATPLTVTIEGQTRGQAIQVEQQQNVNLRKSSRMSKWTVYKWTDSY